MFHREKSLAKKYWDKLFKEYCITDLSRYKENKVRILDYLSAYFSPSRLCIIDYRSITKIYNENVDLYQSMY